MECEFEIELREPEADKILFQPTIKFRLIQLNMTPECMTNKEIDFQIDELINKAEELRKTAKKKLQAALSNHDKLISR